MIQNMTQFENMCTIEETHNEEKQHIRPCQFVNMWPWGSVGQPVTSYPLPPATSQRGQQPSPYWTITDERDGPTELELRVTVVIVVEVGVAFVVPTATANSTAAVTPASQGPTQP